MVPRRVRCDAHGAARLRRLDAARDAAAPAHRAGVRRGAPRRPRNVRGVCAAAGAARPALPAHEPVALHVVRATRPVRRRRARARRARRRGGRRGHRASLRPAGANEGYRRDGRLPYGRGRGCALGLRGVQGLRDGGAAARRARCRLRCHQRARAGRERQHIQPGLRADAQPLRPRPHAGRLLRRRGLGGGYGYLRHRCLLRGHRRLYAHPRAVQRPLRL